MKKLILVRHGKSSWEHQVADDKRPLKKRAFNDAKLVSEEYRNNFDSSTVIWSSYAVRALETAKIFKEEFNCENGKFHIKPNLYTFTTSEVFKEIISCPDTISTLMIFGHNPAFTGFINKYGNKSVDNLPTTGLCEIHFEIDSWKKLESGKTVLTLFPKNLR